MPTLQDVAKRAGVSIATVSKVLSNTPYFSQETRERVMQAVSELGYVPNLAARALSSGRTHIVAVVFPYVYDPIFKDPLVMHILEGIEAELTQEKYNLLLSTPRLQPNDVEAAYRELIGSGYVEGVIALDNVPMASVAEAAAEQNVPAVVLGYHQAPFSVRCDDFAGGQMIYEHLKGLGHDHVGLIGVGPNLNYAVDAREDGVRAAMRSAGYDPDTMPRVDGDYSSSSGGRAAEQLINAHPDLTAIICMNDRMAIGAIQRLQDLGYRIPDDISVCGYDNIGSAGLIGPGLTTIDQRALQQGRSAAQTLLAVLKGETPDPVILVPTLIVRQSTATPRLVRD